MAIAKAAQIHNTLSSLTPVTHDNTTGHHQYHNHQASSQLLHQHNMQDPSQSQHNFSVENLMTAQQQQAAMHSQDSREASPETGHQGTPPLEDTPASRAAAAAAAMASWSNSNCSHQAYSEENLQDNVAASAAASNYRAWYTIPPAGSPLGGAVNHQVDHYHQATTPPTSASGVASNAASLSRDSYTAAAAAAAAAAAYRSSMFPHYQDCNTAEIPKY